MISQASDRKREPSPWASQGPKSGLQESATSAESLPWTTRLILESCSKLTSRKRRKEHEFTSLASPFKFPEHTKIIPPGDPRIHIMS